MISPTEIGLLTKRYDREKGNRGVFESHWQEILDHVWPKKANVTQVSSPGQKKMTKVYDSTAIRALELFAAGLNSFLTSTVNRWFSLRTKDRDWMEYYIVKEWLQDVERRMFDALNSSNFGVQIHDTYMDDGSIGTSTLYVEEDPDEVLRFYTWHIRDYLILENGRGKVDTFFRLFKLSARQMRQMWPAVTFSREVNEALEKEPDKEFEVMHVILPRTERRTDSGLRSEMPIASIYWEKKTLHLIDEGGYQELPAICTRVAKQKLEHYGRSPAMTALPDIKMLNLMDKHTLQAAQKRLDPPQFVPDDGVVGNVKLTPGGLTYIRLNAIKAGFNKPMPMMQGGDLGLSLELMQRRIRSIESAFFVDLFLLLMERPTMTATEVLERNEERMALLSPILGRLMSEKLNPLIKRVFGILLRGGYLDPPPTVLADQQLVVEYISPLARAQKLYEQKTINRTFADISPYGTIDERVWDNFNFDAIARFTADINGFPEHLLRTTDERDAIRAARAEQIQQETMKQDAALMAETMSKLRQGGGAPLALPAA